LKKIVLIILIILIFVVVALNLYMRGSLVTDNETAYLMVHQGDSFTSILKRADSLHLKLSPLLAKTYIKIYGAEKKILPGRYTITSDISRLELLRRLKNGSFDYVWITLPEGLTFDGALKILAQKSGRSKAEFERLLKDSSFLASLPLAPVDIEGYLFPETYKVPYNADPDYLLRTIVRSLADFLNDGHIARMEELGLSVRQLLTFASLIEAETADPDEMPLISAVFHNRLQKNMRLQCDPTVIYALGGLDRPLQLKDLDYDSPYNTYVYGGLPPGPINSPGAKAVLAALYPTPSDYLFFVADTNGQHLFSTTNAQHEKYRREIRRKKSAMKSHSIDHSSSQNE
jgi:UPF0755 protein